MTPAPGRRAAAPEIDIQVTSPLWDAQPLAAAAVRDAIAAAAAQVALGGEVSVVLTDDAAMQQLNRDWRGIDRPTNVLSFPAAKTGAAPFLGDIVIAYETLARECAEENRAFLHHLAHLTVHGFLHLIGYDHQNDSRRRRDGRARKHDHADHDHARPLSGARPRRYLNAKPENNARQRTPKFQPQRRRSLRAAPPAGAGEPAARQRRKLVHARVPRAVRLETEFARRLQGRARRHAARRIRLLAGRKPDAQEHPRPARAPRRRRDDPARRHHRRAAGHQARRPGAHVRGRRAFAAGGLQRHARRSDRHGAHPRPDRVHDRARGGRSGKERQTQEAAAGGPRSQGDRSRHAACRRPRSCARSCSCRHRRA